MANKIPASVTRHPWGNAQVDKMGAVGVTAEEMKVRTGAGLPAPEVTDCAGRPDGIHQPNTVFRQPAIGRTEYQAPSPHPWGRSMIVSWLRCNQSLSF